MMPDRFDSSRSDFVSLARYLMLANGSPTDAAIEAGTRASERVSRILRHAAAADLSSPSWAGSLVDFKIAVGGFVEGLRQHSVFDAMIAGGGRVVPIGSRAVSASAVISGSVVAPGAVKSVSELALENDALEPMKASAIVVASEELLRSDLAEAFLSRELRNAVGSATDAAFLAGIVGSLTQSGTASLPADLAGALAQMDLHAGSRLYLIASAAQVAKLAAKANAAGEFLYPDLSVSGGTVAGIQVIASDSLHEPSAGAALLVDSSGLVFGDGVLTLSAGRHATVAMDNGETANFSLWQRNVAAIKAERHFSYAVIRETATVEITAPAW